MEHTYIKLDKGQTQPLVLKINILLSSAQDTTEAASELPKQFVNLNKTQAASKLQLAICQY